MATPTRFLKIGLAGRKSATTSSDPIAQQFTIPVTIVASTAEQDTGIEMPTGAAEVSVGVNVLTAEVTGTTKTVDVGITSNADALIDASDVSATGYLTRTGGAGELPFPVNVSGTNITYALGSTDFVELKAEIVVTVAGVN